MSANSMSASDSQPPKPEPNSPVNQAPIEQSDAPNGAEGDQEGDEEEQGECGFCLFMKAGGCRDSFTDWEKCIEEGQKNKEDIVDKCGEKTKALMDCMLVHSDYYRPILEIEKAAEQEVVDESEKEAAGRHPDEITDQNGSDTNQSQNDSGNKGASDDK
ncbi:hypothetical protein L6164_020833 [Bauhinia variegata]|uniref:Uncharacterized protein n=1 Tax=Bauhinia variegata TaxID=167791 RepID=A0ACB9MXS9_BAUVA|nr:hypothetical protein L6164_020833 [Bauhinia variegata]